MNLGRGILRCGSLVAVLALTACANEGDVSELFGVGDRDGGGAAASAAGGGPVSTATPTGGAGGSPTVLPDGAPPPPPVDGGASASDAGLPYESLFAPENVPEFFIIVSPESRAALDADPATYQPVTFQYGDTIVENVGMRLKGRASFETLDGKAALKLKFNEYVSGQQFMGLRRLTLNNMIQDASKVRECLGYWVFRSVGVDASLCNHARVYVNGEYFGLYANVETIDRTFLEARYQPAPGNLYDTTNATYDVDFDRSLEQGGLFQGPQPPVETLFELETNTTVPDTSDLTALINAISLSSDATFLAEVDAVMDLDAVLLNGAVQAILADWDGFFGAHNNFKVYHELERDRFILFPWGIDQTFGYMEHSFTKLGYHIDGSDSERDRALLFRRCLADAGCLVRYHDAVREALAIWDTLPLAAEATAMLDRIAPSLAEPSRDQVTPQEHEAEAAGLMQFIAERGAIVAGQL